MKVLVTGGAGFIGSNLVKELLRRGYEVRILDNLSTGRRENIDEFIDNVEFFEGDIRSYHIVHRAVDGVDYILHQAALPSVPRSISDPITTNEVNINGTLHILTLALEQGVKRVVAASSSSIYGDSETLPKHEGLRPDPLSPYAVSKLAGEKYCLNFYNIYGLETVSLRYFNVFGPNQDPNSQYSAVIPKFVKSLMNGKPPTIFGDGTQSRDFTFVDNVVHANLLAMESPNAAGKYYNVAGHQQILVKKLFEDLRKLADADNIQPIYAPERPGEIKHSYADISKIRNDMGYEPVVSFEEGLEKTFSYYEKIYR